MSSVTPSPMGVWSLRPRQLFKKINTEIHLSIQWPAFLLLLLPPTSQLCFNFHFGIYFFVFITGVFCTINKKVAENWWMKFKRKILTFGGGIQTRSLGNELNRRQIPHCPSDRGIRAVISKLWQHLRSAQSQKDLRYCAGCSKCHEKTQTSTVMSEGDFLKIYLCYWVITEILHYAIVFIDTIVAWSPELKKSLPVSFLPLALSLWVLQG